MTKVPNKPFAELAPSTTVSKDQVKRNIYGRYLEEFTEGEIFEHPREITIDRAFAQEFATTFMDANPLFLSAAYAKAHGFQDMLVSSLQVFNIALSLGVQNDSEKALANLGYYNVQFLKPVYPEDTLSAKTKILKVDDKGTDKPGIVSVRTICLNQKKELVLQYERKIMIYHSNGKPKGNPKPVIKDAFFPETDTPVIELPSLKFPTEFKSATWPDTYFENFNQARFTFIKMEERSRTNIFLGLTESETLTHFTTTNCILPEFQVRWEESLSSTEVSSSRGYAEWLPEISPKT